MAGDWIRDLYIRRQISSGAFRVIIMGEAPKVTTFSLPVVHRPTAISQSEDETHFNETTLKSILEEEVLLGLVVGDRAVTTFHISGSPAI